MFPLLYPSEASWPGGMWGHVPPSIGVSETFGNLRSVRLRAEIRHLRTKARMIKFLTKFPTISSNKCLIVYRTKTGKHLKILVKINKVFSNFVLLDSAKVISSE